MVSDDIPRERPGRKRTREESPDARKSLRTDLFYSWPGAELKGPRTQATNEVAHLSHRVGKDTVSYIYCHHMDRTNIDNS